MPISLTNIMEWSGSGVAIIGAISSIIEVVVVGTHTTVFGVLMVAGLAVATVGWLLERGKGSVGSTAITAEADWR